MAPCGELTDDAESIGIDCGARVKHSTSLRPGSSGAVSQAPPRYGAARLACW
jgi:hypothetical protein